MCVESRTGGRCLYNFFILTSEKLTVYCRALHLFYQPVRRFQSSFSLLMNSSTDFTVVLLKYSIISVKVCTCCCNIYFCISAPCIIKLNRVTSSSASCLSSDAFIAWSFDSFSSVVNLSLSVFNCSITVVKLTSGLEVFCSSISCGSGLESTHTLAPRLSSDTLLSAALLDAGARIASKDRPTPRQSSR